MIRVSDRCTEGHGLDSCRELRFFFSLYHARDEMNIHRLKMLAIFLSSIVLSVYFNFFHYVFLLFFPLRWDYIAIIPTRSTLTMWLNYLGTKLVGTAFKLKKRRRRPS